MTKQSSVSFNALTVITDKSVAESVTMKALSAAKANIDKLAISTRTLAKTEAKVTGLVESLAQTLVSCVPAAVIVKAKGMTANGNKDCERNKYLATAEGSPLAKFRDAYYAATTGNLSTADLKFEKQITQTMHTQYSRALARAEKIANSMLWAMDETKRLESEKVAAEKKADKATGKVKESAEKAAKLISQKIQTIQKSPEAAFKKVPAKAKTATSEYKEMVDLVNKAIKIAQEFEPTGKSKTATKIQDLRRELALALEHMES